jgi:lipoyl(octanoyl) transferase
MKESWLFWDDIERPPQENMDIDALLLKQAAILCGKPLIRFYGWDRPSVTIGYVQKEEIVSDRDKYTVVKRPTGGGVVYHDRDFTYTVVVPAEHWIAELDRVESYRVFHKAIVRAFAFFGLKGLLVNTEQPKTDRATMQCFVTPTKYDVLCELSNGKTAKFAGSAQRRTKNGILHQGSIILDAAKGDRQLLATTLKKAFEAEFKISFKKFNLHSFYLSRDLRQDVASYQCNKPADIQKRYKKI